MENNSTPSRRPETASIDPKTPRLWPRLAVLAGLLLAALLVALHFSLPPAAASDAPAAEFSAARAMAHLPAFATEPRPAGSPAHERTRAYLLAELEKLGLEPQVQEAASVLRFPGAPGFSAGTVKNVIARLPGTAPSGAIALDAHYDGADTGPAAADCGSGVITLLETLRALKAAPPLKNDIIFVFADAEEVGDLGAHAFASGHPWMEDVRLALNYEAMGTRGPAYLYATSANNRRLAATYAKIAPGALSNSFLVGLPALFPQGRLACDLQDYLDAGAAGYGFVFSGNSPAYHTPFDNAASLSPRTIQQLGNKTLALLRHFGNAPLGRLSSKTDAAFFTLWPGSLVRYPATCALPLALLAAALLLALAGWGITHDKLGARKLIFASFVFLLGSLLSTALAIGAWWVIKTVNPNLQVLQIGSRATGWFLAGLLLLAAVLTANLSFRLERRLSFLHQATGAVLGYALLALVLGAVYPVGNYLFLWPALAGLPALFWLFFAGEPARRPWGAAAAVLSVAIPAIVLIAPVMAGPNPFLALLVRLDAMTGLPLLGVDSLFATLLTGLLVPLLGASGILTKGRWLAAAAVLALAVLAIGWTRSGYDAEYPRPEGIRYELDADTGAARWVTGDARLGDWTGQFISPETAQLKSEGAGLLFYWPASFSAAAPALPLEAPALTVVQDTIAVGRRKMRLVLQTPYPGALLQARLKANGPLRAAALQGEPLRLDGYPAAAQGELLINYSACPPEGFELMIELEDTGPLTATLVTMATGLPELPGEVLPERPQTAMPALLGADSRVVRKAFVVEGRKP